MKKHPTSPQNSEKPKTAPIEKVDDRFRWLSLIGKDKSISPIAVRIALLLALEYFSRRRMIAFPSQQKLADDTNTAVSSVRRAIKELSDAGYLNSFKAFGSSNRYTFCIPIRSPVSGLSDGCDEDANPLTGELSIRSPVSAQSAHRRAPNHMSEPCRSEVPTEPQRSLLLSHLDNESPSESVEKAAREGAATPKVKVDDEIDLPGIGCGWVDKIISHAPLITVVLVRDDEGYARAYRVEHSAEGLLRKRPISLNEAESLPAQPYEEDSTDEAA